MKKKTLLGLMLVVCIAGITTEASDNRVKSEQEEYDLISK